MSTNILLSAYIEGNSSFNDFFVEYVAYLKKQGYGVFVITDNKSLNVMVRRLKAELIIVEVKKNNNKFINYFYKKYYFMKNFVFIKKLILEKKIKVFHIFDTYNTAFIRGLRKEHKSLKLFINLSIGCDFKNIENDVKKVFTCSPEIIKNMDKKVEILPLAINNEKYKLSKITDERFKNLCIAWNVDQRVNTFVVVMEKYSKFYDGFYKAVAELKNQNFEFKVFILVKDLEFANIASAEKEKLANLDINDICGFVYNDNDTDCVFKICNCYIEANDKVYYSYYARVAKNLGKYVIISPVYEGVNYIEFDVNGKFYNFNDYTSVLAQMQGFLEKNKREKLKIEEYNLNHIDNNDVIKNYQIMSEGY